MAPLGRPGLAGAKRVGELRDDAILQIEDLIERTIGLGIRQALAGDDVDDARGDAQAIAGALVTADHRAIDAERAAQRRQLATGLRDASMTRTRSMIRGVATQIVGDRFRDAGRQPRATGVAADILEVQHRHRRRRSGGGGAAAVPRPASTRHDRLDRGDEAISASRNCLNVFRIRGVVAERLTQLGHCLGQRVVGDRHVRPQGLEELVLRDQH